MRDDNEEIKSEGHSPKEMTHSFRDEEFALHKVQNTPVARSVQHSNTWSSFTSNGLSSSLSAWFGGENSSPSSSSTSSFLPYCGSQSSAGDFDISRENPRYSDPTTRKINSTSNSSAVHDAVPFTRQREGVGNTAPGTQYIWGAIARHVEMFSDTDMQLAGLI